MVLLEKAMFCEAAASCLLIVLTIVCIYRRKTVSSKRYPKGPWSVPVLGSLPFIGALPRITFQKWREKYGNVFKIRLGSWDTVVVNGEAAMREIINKKDAFSGRPPFGTQHLLKEVYDGIESLSLTNFDDSYIQHIKLTKAGLRIYTHERSHELEDLIFEESIKMIDSILQQRQESDCLFKRLATLTTRLLFQRRGSDVIKSEQLKAMLATPDEFVRSLKGGNVVDVLPWLKFVIPSAVENLRRMMKVYNSAGKENIDEHIRTFDEQNIRDLTDVFLATKLEDTNNSNKEYKSISRKRLLYTVLDLFSAGMVTTTSTLRWLFLYIIEFPEVQRQVFEEINNTIGQNRRIVWADHVKMPYTQATLKEVMRIRPTSPFGLLHYTTEGTQLDNLDIDKGTVVIINCHSVSQDPSFWGDPQNFRPDRYLLANGQLDPVKMKYEVTFGVGRRMCLGETLAKKELFLIFTTLIQRCVFSKPESVVFNFEPVVGITYNPKPFSTLVKQRI